MKIIYYLSRHDATHRTSDRAEALRIATDWIRLGYEVTAVVKPDPSSSTVRPRTIAMRKAGKRQAKRGK